MLGAEQVRGGPLGFLDRRRARREVVEVSSGTACRVDPDAVVEDLPVGVQQRVEIVKALTRDVDLLILDEPTAVLTPQETDELLAVMRVAQGRPASRSSSSPTSCGGQGDRRPDHRDPARPDRRHRRRPTRSEDELAALMVGRSVSLEVRQGAGRAGRAGAGGRRPGRRRRPRPPRGRRRRPDRPGRRGARHRRRAGQRADRAGRGDHGPAPAAGRHDHRSAGDGSTGWPTKRDPARRRRATCPRTAASTAWSRSSRVAENLVLDMYDRPPFGNAVRAQPGRDRRRRRRSGSTQFDIRTLVGARPPVGTLSGGNQQKVIVAREMSRPLKLFIAAQPTRGVDVGSIEFIHRRIMHERDVGTAVLRGLQRAGRGGRRWPTGSP